MYIPTEQERIKVYSKINHHRSNNQNNINISNINQKNNEKDNMIKLSKDDITNLVARLTKDTKRQSIMKQQIDKIRKINIQKKRISQNAQKVEQRLIKAGQQLQIKKQRLRQQQRIKQQSLIQPSPNISSRAKSKIDKPFIERVDNIIQQKQKTMMQLNSKYEPLFKPKLNTYSIFLAELHQSKNFLQRVQEYNETKQQKIKEKIQKKQKQQLKQATFQPQINENSRIISLKQSRQNSYINNSQKRINHSLDKNKFKPEINKKSEQIMTKKRNDSNVEPHQRLYEDMRKISRKKLEKRIQIQKQQTFKPKINRKSLQILSKKMSPHITIQTHLDNLEDEYEQIIFSKSKTGNKSSSIKTQEQDNQFLNFDINQIKFKGNMQNQNYNISNFPSNHHRENIKNLR